MSVTKSKRGLSQLEFLENAQKLKIYTRTQCKKLPKKDYRWGLFKTYECAEDIVSNIRKGNSTFPQNEIEVQIRRNYFNEAYRGLMDLIGLIGEIKDEYPIKDTTMCEWMKYVSTEIKLIKGVLESDRKRYKTLCNI